MKRYFLGFAIIVFSAVSGMSQNYEEEISFQYVKAKYLVDTERWDEGLKILSEIIKKDENYENAMLLRAECKFMLAAYKGAKMDLLAHLGNKGVTAENSAWLGRTMYALEEKEGALNCITSALYLDPENPKLFELRGEIYAEQGNDVSACEDWNNAYKYGSGKAEYYLQKNCGMTNGNPIVTKVPETKKPTYQEPKKDNGPITEGKRVEDDLENDGKVSAVDNTENNGMDDSKMDSEMNENKVENVEDTTDELPVPEPEHEKENVIVIDEDLTLTIYGMGLGERKVLDRPSILILSDVDGEVTVDVCVNERGKVESAEYNPKLSTIDKKSLVSLAIRKSKEFWFEKLGKKEQCGYIVFKIQSS